MKPGYYSDHFSHKEMAASDVAPRRGIDNTPTPAAAKKLEELCTNVLEKLRARFGPIRVTSGYRCAALNAAIGGSGTSAHMDGCAADIEFIDPTVSLKEVMAWIESSEMEFDQAIYEYVGGWLHVGIAKPGRNPRRELLMIFGGTGYMTYDPTDSRVA